MLVRLPLPYIRPFGSKCFAVGLLHFGGSGFKAGDLLLLHGRQPHPPRTCDQPLVPFYVQNTRKERLPVLPPERTRAQHSQHFLTRIRNVANVALWCALVAVREVFPFSCFEHRMAPGAGHTSVEGVADAHGATVSPLL